MSTRILHADVFTARRFYGNPLAVLLQIQESAQMQRVANWLNLSETTFAEAFADRLGYSVRIFTPKQELPFAGHPSLGTAAALLHAGLLDPKSLRFTQRCAAGDLPIWRSSFQPDCLWFVQAPEAQVLALNASAVAELAHACGAPFGAEEPMPRVIQIGPRWAVAGFADAAAVLALTPDLPAMAAWNLAHDNIGLAAYGRGVDASGPYLEVRCFVPIDGIAEDPVTGSGNAAIAAFLHAHNALSSLARRYRAMQGQSLGREGELAVEISDAGVVSIGGRVQIVADGMIEL
jgi:PhzF family phenazine biosynthesis protein